MKYLAIIIFAFGFSQVDAQQDIILTNYTFKNVQFNPSVAGILGSEFNNVYVSYRDQWIGFEGSPKTFIGGADLSMMEDRVGIAVSLSKESIGINSQIELTGNYAYKVDLGEGKISGGIRTSFFRINSNLSELENVDIDDPLYDLDQNGINIFSVGAGLYYLNNGFNAGLSIPSIAAVSQKGSPFKARHIYFHTGMTIESNYSDLKFEPNILVKYQKSTRLQYTMSMMVWFTKNIAVGPVYRSNDAVALAVKWEIWDKLAIVTAYDFTTSELRKTSDNTVELGMSYSFNKGNRRN